MEIIGQVFKKKMPIQESPNRSISPYYSVKSTKNGFSCYQSSCLQQSTWDWSKREMWKETLFQLLVLWQRVGKFWATDFSPVSKKEYKTRAFVWAEGKIKLTIPPGFVEIFGYEMPMKPTGQAFCLTILSLQPHGLRASPLEASHLISLCTVGICQKSQAERLQLWHILLPHQMERSTEQVFLTLKSTPKAASQPLCHSALPS